MAEITLRQNKTSALLFAEMDANFENINLELIANTDKLNAATDNNVADALVIRNNVGDISVSTVHGDLDGSALQVVANEADTAVGTHYITFLDGQTGDKSNLTDVALTYDPSLNKLVAGTFSGIGEFTTLTTTGTTTIGDAAGDVLTVNATPTFQTGVTFINNISVGGEITTSQSTFKILDTSATTVDFAKAATTLTIGATTGTTVIRNAVTIQGGTAWHSGNDGNGSGLDADVLRGAAPSVAATPNTIVKRDATGAIVGTITGTTDNANKVAVTSNNDNATYYPLFAKPSDISTGYTPTLVDDTLTPLSYNPNTSTLTVGTLSGNATSADEWSTARTITLGGDLSGSALFDGSGDFTLTATINADSVALGTDTTGNYVASGATSGNGISGSVSSEGGTFTVTSNATSANTANTIVYRDASGNFTAGTITAALSGNASTATTLQNSRTINGVAFNGSSNITVEPFVEDDEGTNATRYITFVDNSISGHKRLNEDSSLTYNPSTNTLTVTNLVGNASTATTASRWATARNINLAGDLSGSTSIDGSANVTITATVADDSHNHVISNVDGLQSALDGKLSTSGKAADSNLLDGIDSSGFLRSSGSTTHTSGDVIVANGDLVTYRSGGGSGVIFLNSARNRYLYYSGSQYVTNAADLNISGGNLIVGNGDITLGGTGRIQGVDTVSASTDAANKAYVDSKPFVQDTGGGAPFYGARAWVNFNGRGTVSIRDSDNVSSITDIATGQYRVNFSTNMPSSNYCVNVTVKEFDSTQGSGVYPSLANDTIAGVFSTSDVEVGGKFGEGYFDCAYVGVSVFI